MTITEESTDRFHPLANAFPLLEGADFGELVADIDEHGQHQPVIMYEGKILDGRNRWRACQRLQIPHTEKQYTGDDPAGYVWSVNAVRRQLTPSQKAMAATKLVTAKRGDNRHTTADKVTTEQAAKLAGVGTKTIERARVVVEHAVPEVQRAVESGELSVNTAQQIARLGPAEQENLMRDTPVKELPGLMSARAVPAPVAVFSDAPVDKPRPSADDEAPETPLPGPGQGYVGPVTRLTNQVEAFSPKPSEDRVKEWAENRALILQIDGGTLDGFLRDLKRERKAIDQLIRLIKIEQDREAGLKGSPRGSGGDVIDLPTRLVDASE